jgi:hypothetical protein
MKLNAQRAKEIRMVFLDEIERTKTVPGNLVQPFWEFYSQEFNVGRYSAQPCTCQPKEWISMVREVTEAVNEALSTENVQAVVNLEQAQQEQEVAKKKTKKVKETTADAADKTTENE